MTYDHNRARTLERAARWDAYVVPVLTPDGLLRAWGVDGRGTLYRDRTDARHQALHDRKDGGDANGLSV